MGELLMGCGEESVPVAADTPPLQDSALKGRGDSN
jgi:hypothetical protein